MTKGLIGVAAFTVCEVQRNYGGPEEGGWYYDHYSPVRVLYVAKDKAERLERLLTRLVSCANKGRPPLYSVASYGVIRLCKGVVTETERPRYE